MTAAECPNCRCRDMGGADWWHEDGEGFRRGRWFVDASEHPYVYVSHEDIIGEAWGCFGLTDWESDTPDAVRAVGASFHAWHDATRLKPPTEPTAYGYIGTILSNYGTTHHVYRYHADNYGYAYSLVGLAAGGEARGLSWGVVLQAGTFTAVTR